RPRTAPARSPALDPPAGDRDAPHSGRLPAPRRARGRRLLREPPPPAHGPAAARPDRQTQGVLSPGLGSLADHVQERLALLVLHRPEGPPEGLGKLRGVLDALAVAAGRAADQLVVERGLERGERHRFGPDCPAVRRL